MRTDLLPLACPSAISCVQNLVLIRARQSHVSRIAPVMSTLATELADSVVLTIESTSGVPLLIRCTMWIDHEWIGFGVEDPTHIDISKTATAQSLPTARWQVTWRARSKLTWFTLPISDHEWTHDAASITRPLPHIGCLAGQGG